MSSTNANPNTGRVVERETTENCRLILQVGLLIILLGKNFPILIRPVACRSETGTTATTFRKIWKAGQFTVPNSFFPPGTPYIVCCTLGLSVSAILYVLPLLMNKRRIATHLISSTLKSRQIWRFKSSQYLRLELPEVP